MASVGVSYPRYAIYSNNGTTVTYSAPASLGKATTVNLSIDASDSNILYADNAPAESAKTFAGGTIKIGTDDLYDDAAVAIFGLTKNTLTTPAAATEIVDSVDQTAPYVGVGFVIKKIQGGVTKWVGVVLKKVQFSDPGYDIATQGESIDWQTPETEGTIFRDDSTANEWRRRATFDTEANAKSYVDGILGVTAG